MSPVAVLSSFRGVCALGGWGLVTALVSLACTTHPPSPYGYCVSFEIVDEAGDPIAGASVEVEGQRWLADRSGAVELCDRLAPDAALVAAAGYLPEPLVFDRSDAEGRVRVRLFASRGPDGSPRWAMHAGGDAMLGRRYLAPEEGPPQVPATDIAGASRRVVAALAPVFGLGDLNTLNLECVVGDFPESAEYPGKRFILQSPPEALAALDELSVDVVTLGNNHIRDYLDVGVRETFAALDDAGIPYVGASDGAGLEAELIRLEPRPGVEVAMLSYTTVDGDFVNGRYPDASEPEPPECGGTEPPADCFMFEARSFGCAGEDVSIPAASYRIGSAWLAYSELEDQMSEAERASCWSTIESVYPEMQDWTARRGHGGATGWDDESSLAAIATADSDADLVVVQLHAGFQFQTAPSTNVQRIARASIDAGADIVIAHHPHVLQGAEWYEGKLILYSLGNLLFDQDFLVTFTSAFLRTVWEGSTLLEARLMPVELVGYRPRPIAGQGAARTVAMLWEASASPAFTARDEEGEVRRYLGSGPGPGTTPAHLRRRHHSGVIVAQPPASEALSVELPGQGLGVELGFEGLIRAGPDASGFELGRPLFGWGHLEDVLADAEVMPGAHWFMPSEGRLDPLLRLDNNAAEGFGWIDMFRSATLSGETFARPIARVPLPEHRLYRSEAGETLPDDGVASYTMRMQARLEGGGQAYVRLEFFEFDDTDPTQDPTTLAIGGPVDLPLTVTADGAWHLVEIEVPSELLWTDDTRANVVLVRVRFAPPSEGESVFGLDEFEYVEWRAADSLQAQWGDYHFARSVTGLSVELEGLAYDD